MERNACVSLKIVCIGRRLKAEKRTKNETKKVFLMQISLEQELKRHGFTY